MSLLGEEGETSAAELSIVLLQTGSAKKTQNKHFLATFTNAYLKKINMHSIVFFHRFSLLSDSR